MRASRIIKKRRTREHIIADLSVNHVERHALLAGYIVTPQARDYGIDLVMTTFDTGGELEEGAVLFQLKATEALRLSSDRSEVLFSVSASDLASWLVQRPPFILVIYDVQGDVAYWLYVQAYFARLPGFDLSTMGQTITARIPVSNVVSEGVMRRFAQFRDRVFLQTQQVTHDEF